MPPTGRQRHRQRQGQRAALNRPWLTDPGTPEPPATPRDRFVDYPPLDGITHPTWWHVYRIESPRDVLIFECPHEHEGHWVMARERWRTRMSKWKCESFESVHPLHPGVAK